MDNVYACLTTLSDRTKALEETINSLLPQVDKIFLFLHGYTPTMLPDFLDENEKIEIAYDLEWGDRGDLDKFHSVKDLNGYILNCDDDLIYPSDYAEKMIEAIEKHERKALISAHGSIIFPLPIAHYYLDRYVYPCLGNVFNEVQVQFGGTGVMAFHTDIQFDLDFQDKTPNMADIHVGIWALEKNIPIWVIPHMTGWINHSTNVSYGNTIAGKAFNNHYDIIELINSKGYLFKTGFKKRSRQPKVTVAIVNSRMRSNPEMIKQCYDSIRMQTYSNIQIVVIENHEKLFTIGKGFNDAAKKAKGKYILYLGDDDFITNDYITTLVSLIENNDAPKAVGVSSYLTLFRVTQNNIMTREPRELIPTGMWKTNFVRKFKFKEYLTKYVDSEFMDRAKEEGYAQLIAAHSYGYFYRSHPQQISGFKEFGGAHSTLPNSGVKINKKLKEIEANETK